MGKVYFFSIFLILKKFLIKRGLKKCKGPVNNLQNEAVIKDGAVRLLPHLQCTNFHDEYFQKLGYFSCKRGFIVFARFFTRYNPFYTGHEIVFGNMFAGLPVRWNKISQFILFTFKIFPLHLIEKILH